jgi:succinate dehydrogenase / fumarate reductase, cytochrome b subunit
MRYKVHQGSLAFMLHRLTGVMLIGYLIVHIMALTGLQDPIDFAEKMELLTHPIFQFFEYLLFLPILFHSLNGIRLVIVEWTDKGSKNHKKMLAAVYTVSAILAAIMAVVFYNHEPYDKDGVHRYNQRLQSKTETTTSLKYTIANKKTEACTFDEKQTDDCCKSDATNE